MELIKSPPATMNCYLLKPIAIHFHLKTDNGGLRCEILCKFPKKGVELTIPSFDIVPNRSNVIRLSGIQTLPDDVLSFVAQLKFTDEFDNTIITKTKIKVARNLKMQAYLNLNQRGTNAHYVFIPNFNWDSILPTNTN